ncbi:MAG: iron ABC transporter [delta proteobacterium ML8_D]|jgi:iron complex transport system permease protein|nr:MAG: iron ABC transporter [Firmicutes bacterium ML8_F2]OPL13259.1 MAG: iron ABC transporter [delta proteobacterium ML8_D]
MNTGSRPNRLIPLALLLILAIIVFSCAPIIGMNTIPLSAVLHPASGGMESNIFWKIRIPRVCISFLAGAGLSVSGMAFQAMFRNPLATPFTLGVASGASLGAAIYVRLGLVFSVFGISGISIASFAGAIFSILLVYGLTRARRGFSTATMLLAGVAISFFFSSVILFTQYMSDFSQSFRILRWLMGGLEVVGFESVLNMAPFVISGSVIIIYMTYELNLMTTGEEIAISRGVNVWKTKNILFFATSLMVGGIVAICGPIGFVGMMVPHICRLLIGADHRYLTPATLMFGGAFLTLCDMLARTLIAPAEIPVGIITALLGGPFFIWLLLGKTSYKRGII